MPIFSFIEHNLQDLFEKETTGGEYIYQRVRLFIYQTMCVSKLTRKDISDVVFSKFTHVSLYKSAEIHTSVNAYGICNNGPFGNIGIGISASASALTSVSTSALQQIYFVFRSLYFCLSKFYMKKTSMVKYFSSELADLPRSFRRCLEQLFCRKPVSACFWRKKLQSRCYLRSFKTGKA